MAYFKQINSRDNREEVIEHVIRPFENARWLRDHHKKDGLMDVEETYLLTELLKGRILQITETTHSKTYIFID